MFDTFVWPQSIRVPNESLKSVSNVLKIFSLWSERPKYYPLFVIKLQHFTQIDANLISSIRSMEEAKNIGLIETYERKNLLDILFDLIDSNRCSCAVVDYVIEMVHNFVSFANFSEEDEITHDSDFSQKTKALPFDVNFVEDEFKGGEKNGEHIFQV